jgi:hypothetical protein
MNCVDFEQRQTNTSAKVTTNAGVLRCAQNDRRLGWVDDKKGRAITARPALRNDDALGGVGVEDYFGPAVVAVVEVFVGVGGFG